MFENLSLVLESQVKMVWEGSLVVEAEEGFQEKEAAKGFLVKEVKEEFLEEERSLVVGAEEEFLAREELHLEVEAPLHQFLS